MMTQEQSKASAIASVAGQNGPDHASRYSRQARVVRADDQHPASLFDGLGDSHRASILATAQGYYIGSQGSGADGQQDHKDKGKPGVN